MAISGTRPAYSDASSGPRPNRLPCSKLQARYAALMAGLKQSELVERAIDEYVERHREEFQRRMEWAQDALLGGKASTLRPENGDHLSLCPDLPNRVAFSESAVAVALGDLSAELASRCADCQGAQSDRRACARRC